MNRNTEQPPLTVAEFRKLPEGLESDYVIPEVPQKRKVTDLKYTIILAVCLGLVAIFLIISGSQVHISRITNGYDYCGNVCGEKNDFIEGVPCFGEDDRNKPFLQFSRDDSSSGATKAVCVETCGEDYYEVFNRCFPGKSSDISLYFTEVADDLRNGAGYLVALILIGLGACLGMLALFRYFPAFIVWIILIGSVLGMFILTCALWYAVGVVEEQAAPSMKVFAIFLTIVTLILFAVLVCLYKKINLVIRLFKEAMKAVFGIPLILFEPLLTFVASLVLLSAFIFLQFVLRSAGELHQVHLGVYQYVETNFIIFTLWFNVFMFIWMAQFIVGCQHMVVSGAISAYYFARDRTSVASPIYNSFYNLIRYHLGTVAIGSLVITIVTIIRALIRKMVNNRGLQMLIDCCMQPIEDFFRYLTKNAYIQTAMHGQSFFKSGKRAARLLIANALSAVAINSIGDFVMFMAKLLISLFTVLIGVAMLVNSEIKHYYIIVIIGFIVTAILADCFFSVFETAVDTLFLCFCEDMAMNDGVSQSFYMSTDLMQYIEDAKKVYKKQ